VARDVALSAISAGFKNIVFIEDHGGAAQTTLGKVAEELNAESGPKGTHVYHIPDLYFKEKEAMKDYMAKHDLPYDSHAGTDDTSEVMFIDKEHKWIRPDKLIKDTGGPSGVNGDQTKATIEMGKMFTDYKIQFAVAQIKNLVN
jgi:creatinine amidohydrolase/Fe(II)-dependent formamide hydrolase-like protein